MNATDLAPAPAPASTTALPASQNESFGFWGTMGGYACLAWPLAMQAICRATNEDAYDVRVFLDSRFGRHFADSVNDARHQGLDLTAAIEQAVTHWMTWRIGRTAHQRYDIPMGTPHLVGFVIHCSIVEDAAGDV